MMSRAWALLGIAGLVLLLPLLRRVELGLEELLLVALGFGLAVQHERMLFLFGIRRGTRPLPSARGRVGSV